MSQLDEAIGELESAVAHAARLYAQHRVMLQRRIDTYRADYPFLAVPGETPEDRLDRNGRPILLDAAVAMASARAALATALASRARWPE